MSAEIDPSDHESSLRGSAATHESRNDDADVPPISGVDDVAVDVNTDSGVDIDTTSAVDVGGLFERVLVVTDGDAPGRAAVDAGIDLAATHGATVDALYVVDTTEHWDMAVERRERAGEAAVEEAAARGDRADVDVEKWFRYGTAHEEVIAFAERHEVDVIVVGSARRTGLDRFVNPEVVPVRVQRGASCPVLVVGTDEE